MSQIARPRRSVLYMPGSNPRALEKAEALPADALILDLEDAVAPDAKVEARTIVVEKANAKPYGLREVLIRTNGLATPWGFEDIAAAAKSAADGVLLPKVESADMVRQAEAILNQAGAPAEMKIWCMMETPMGMLKAEEIAASTPRMGGMVMGTSDLAKDLHAAHVPGREPFLTSLGLCLLAARAYNLAIVDGVSLDLNDEDALAAACQQGADMGFDGKTLIHPKQIAAANAAFGPTEAEIEQARRLIDAFRAAEAEGKGVVLLDGKLVENLHVVNAERILAEADAITKLDAGAKA